MAERANQDLAAQVSAAFAWWRDAGVDCLFHDEPADWIIPQPAADVAGRPSPVAVDTAKQTDAAPPKPAIDPAAIPGDLDAFTAWWLSEPMLDNGRVAGRVPPRGSAGAELMVIVAEPEREDRDILLSGPEGRLLDAILAAFDIGPDQVYVASALPRHTPMVDWAELAQTGIGQVLARHVKLVQPRRLIAFGNNALPLMSNDSTNTVQISGHFNHENLSIPYFVATELGMLLARPRAKGRLWRQWLDWIGIGPT